MSNSPYGIDVSQGKRNGPFQMGISYWDLKMTLRLLRSPDSAIWRLDNLKFWWFLERTIEDMLHCFWRKRCSFIQRKEKFQLLCSKFLTDLDRPYKNILFHFEHFILKPTKDARCKMWRTLHIQYHDYCKRLMWDIRIKMLWQARIIFFKASGCACSKSIL